MASNQENNTSNDQINEKLLISVGKIVSLPKKIKSGSFLFFLMNIIQILVLNDLRNLIHQIEHVKAIYTESEIILENLAQIHKVLTNLENHLAFIKNVYMAESPEDIMKLKAEEDDDNILISYGHVKRAEDFAQIPLEDGIDFLMADLIPEAEESFSKSFHIQKNGNIIVTKPEENIFDMQLIVTTLNIS